MGVGGHRPSASPPAGSPVALSSASALVVTHVLLSSEGVTKLTNKATLWYVPLSLEDVDRVLEVPPVVVRSPSHSPPGGGLGPCDRGRLVRQGGILGEQWRAESLSGVPQYRCDSSSG